MEQITLPKYTQCKTMFSNVLVHMEYERSLVPKHRASWQNQSYMHVAVITFNHHKHIHSRNLVWCKNLWQSILFAFVLLSVESTWTCHCHVHLFLASQPCKQTVHLSIVSHPSCTHKLHQQRACIYITQIIMVGQIAYVPHWQSLQGLQGLQGSGLYCVFHATQMFSSRHEKNMGRECWHQILSECTDQPSWTACGQCNQSRKYLQGYAFIQPWQGAALS